MFEKLKSIFHSNKENPENVRDFQEAIDWIKTYKKAEDYDTAIFAARELKLKNQSGINYYESALKKIAVLEASNIERVALAAKEKKNKVDTILNGLYKKVSIVEKLLQEIEQEKFASIEKNQKKEMLLVFKQRCREINETVDKKEYHFALSLAKKLAADFPNEKKAFSMLTKIQKLCDNQKTKEEKAEDKHQRLEKVLKDIGVEVSELRKKTGISPIARMKVFLKELRIKTLEKEEYVKRHRALKDLERLLVASGTIENINDESVDAGIFANVHHGLTKDIGDFDLPGFDFYGRILGKDKIVGDTFGFYKDGTRTVFYFGDATGHGVQSGFTVALLSRLFFEHSRKIKSFSELFVTINNELKAKLKGRIFVTAVFFEYDSAVGKLRFIGAGHDPMYVYRRETGITEKIIPGGLALGVRPIVNTTSTKIRELDLATGDVLLGYTDGIIETKDSTNVMYGLPELEANFGREAKKFATNPTRLYEGIMKHVNDFRGAVPFQDDVSMFLFTRNTNKDIVSNRGELEAILKEMDAKKDIKEVNFKNKTREQVIEEVKKERYNRDLKIRLGRLDRLYRMAEFTKLKQEVSLYFRE